MVNADQFSQQLQSTYNQANELYKRTLAPPFGETEIVSDALEELRVALEELHVAEEELLQQNHELAKTRAQAEVERQRYRDLFELAPDGYIVTNEVGVIQEANRAAVELLNVDLQFLIGKPFTNFIPPAERRSFRSKVSQLRKIFFMPEWELRITPRDGEIFDAALTVSTICDNTGKPLGWRWIIRDITARKQAEEKIRNMQLQNLQLQEASRLKSHFLAVMSHELRSPMNAIIGFSQLLLRQNSQSLAQNQANMIERILNNGKHLLNLIEDILDFSKIEVGALKIEPEYLNLAQLVTATFEEMRSLAEQKNLELELQLNLKNPQVFNDKTRLRQILVNLLSNAIKFTDFGSVKVAVFEPSADQVAIAVSDSGIGIAEDDMKHLFQEFWQLNQTLTRKQGGTGLGLAITKQLVNMMQGEISVKSQAGFGSTFCVELPREVQATQVSHRQVLA